MFPSLQNFASLIANMAAAAQGALPGAILRFAPGSLFGALNNGVASVMLWLQWQLVLLWQSIRAATATGTTLDTWMADFGIVREPATYATGNVVLSRFTSTASASVPVGTVVITGDLTQQFLITANASSPYYVAASNSYLIPAGTATAALPVQAVTAGTAGNVAAGAVSLLGSAVAGVDTVTNPAAFTNGEAAETDAALRARFVLFVNTRSLATPSAVAAAVIGVQSGLIYSLFENVSSNGSAQLGNFVVVLDDGSGTPSSALLASVSSAISLVRPVNSTWAVVPPIVSTAVVAIVITPPSGATIASIAPAIQSAVTAYIDALPINNTVAGTTAASTLFLTQISGIVVANSPSGTTVTSVTINGGSGNVVPVAMGAVRSAGVTVT